MLTGFTTQRAAVLTAAKGLTLYLVVEAIVDGTFVHTPN